MANAAVGDIATVQMVGLLYGQTIIYDFAYKVTSISGGLVSRAVLGSALNNEFQTAILSPWAKILAAVSPEYTTRYSQVQFIHPTREPYDRLTNVATASGPGSASSPSASAVITKRINPPHQGGAGHLCIAGLDYNDVGSGRWTGANITALVAIGGSLMTGFSMNTAGSVTTSMLPVVFRRGDPANSPDLFNFAISDEVRTQKRRVVGRGI